MPVTYLYRSSQFCSRGKQENRPILSSSSCLLKQLKLHTEPSDRSVSLASMGTCLAQLSASDHWESESKCFVAPLDSPSSLAPHWRLPSCLCVRESTSERFDSACWNRREDRTRTHRQWGLMKQRGSCEADGSCVASTRPHNQSVTAALRPADTGASIWENTILTAWLRTPCLISRWRRGLLGGPRPLLADFHPWCLLVWFFFWRISADLRAVYARDLSDKASEACLHGPSKCAKLMCCVLTINFSFWYVANVDVQWNVRKTGKII